MMQADAHPHIARPKPTRDDPNFICDMRNCFVQHATIDEKEDVRMSEQPRKVKNEAIPDWADGLYYNKGASPRCSSTTTTRPSTSSTHSALHLRDGRGPENRRRRSRRAS